MPQNINVVMDAVAKQGGPRNERIAALAALTVLILLPVVSHAFFWLNLILPLPVSFIIFKFGRREGGLLTAAGFMLAGAVAMLNGLLPALLVPAAHLPAGVMLGLAASWRMLPWKAGLTAVTAMTAGWFLLGCLYAVQEQRNPYAEMQTALESGIEAAAGITLGDERLPREERESMRATFTRMRELLPELFPAGLAVSLLCMVWLNLVLCHALLQKWHAGGSPWGDSAGWRLPDHAVWLVIASGILLLLPAPLAQFWGKNGAIVLVFLYFFQGLAILAGLLGKWSIPPALRFLIYILAVFQVHFSFLVAILGLADVWADFNKLRVFNNNQA